MSTIEMKSLTREFGAAEPAEAAAFFADKLRFETDAADVFEDLRSGVEKLIIVDARTAESYEKGHVPGALNIPHRTMTRETTASLPPDALIVTYCDGIGCNASTKGALKLAQLGFRVKEMSGGLDFWIRDGFPVAQGTASGHLSDHGIRCGC